jgi:hypothetical protein
MRDIGRKHRTFYAIHGIRHVSLAIYGVAAFV